MCFKCSAAGAGPVVVVGSMASTCRFLIARARQRLRNSGYFLPGQRLRRNPTTAALGRRRLSRSILHLNIDAGDLLSLPTTEIGIHAAARIAGAAGLGGEPPPQLEFRSSSASLFSFVQ